MNAGRAALMLVWRFGCLGGGWALYGAAVPFLWMSQGFSGVGRVLRRASDWLFMRAFAIQRRARQAGGA